MELRAFCAARLEFFSKGGNWGWANGSAVLLAARAAVVSEFLEPTSDPR